MPFLEVFGFCRILRKFAFIVLERFSYDVSKGCRKMSKTCLEAFQRFPLRLSLFFLQTASPSRFFRASRKLFNRPPKVQNAVSYSITLLAQRVFCLSPNVFQKWGKWGGGKSPRLRPISAKITCTALLNSPKVQFFYSMCHCRHIIMARSLLLC